MLIISIEGNIGSGKSTLVNTLKSKLKTITYNGEVYPIIYIDEPVKVWTGIRDRYGKDIITRYYEDQPKYAFQFQMMAYITRLTELRKASKMYNGKCIIITERSVETDRQVFAKMLYEKGIMDDISYHIYLNWFDELSMNLKTDRIVYVKTRPETAMERVLKRARPGEVMSLDYLYKCNEMHERWLNGQKNILTLNGEREFEESFQDHLSAIEKMLITEIARI
jgi:deoxyadenosine/deoxycytidine kinase|tara:strand:- start:1499 stop:2167 length:669 start_codon:yes stop_codon:yes gene_type:complete